MLVLAQGNGGLDVTNALERGGGIFLVGTEFYRA